MRDLAEVFATYKEQSPGMEAPSNTVAYKNDQNIAQEGSTLELAALEIEQWKNRQKGRFQDQLQKLEQHHMNTLSMEWEKRL